ncbi:MAG: winged helix-turn-helix transcriptional regulator [Micropruina sp.]|nr:MAG: winged helix-turn-helix transcriptional regulator [Micropruina sp.]
MCRLAGGHSGAPTQQEVADLAGTDRMMTSRVMAALTAAGLLARTADPRSRRAKRVRPTEEGDRLVQAALASVREVEELLFGGSTTPRSMALRAELRAVCATDPG